MTDVALPLEATAVLNNDDDSQSDHQYPPSDGICHLLRLPAELRMRIYEYALAPTGVLICHQRTAVRPKITPQLLATCSQIHREARQILTHDNEIVLRVDAHNNAFPLLPTKRLPPRVLATFQRLCLVFECMMFYPMSFDMVDFEPFTALTSLKFLRVTILRNTASDDDPAFAFENCVDLLIRLLERLPRDVQVTCDLDPASAQQALVREILAIQRRGRPDPHSILQVQADMLDLAAHTARAEIEERAAWRGSAPQDVHPQTPASTSDTL